MSKTDKTRPWWVQMAESPMVTCVPVHDHRFGPCTLPAEVTADTASLSLRRGRCYWGVAGFYRAGYRGSDGHREWAAFRREERRRDRHRARRDLRDQPGGR
jgi:hypothetical protein